MTNYDLLNQDKAKNEGIELANKHLNMVKEALVKPILGNMTRKVSDLTVADLFELIPKIVRECKRHDAEEAKVAYKEKWPDKITK